MKQKILAVIFVVLGLGLVSLAFKLSIPLPKNLLSPLSEKNTGPYSPKQVIGFFPYWNLDKLDTSDFSALTEVYYFALDINGNGSFNGNDPGWPKLNSSEFERLKEKVKKANLRFGLTIVNLSADSIAQNVNHPEAQDFLVKSTVDVMKQKGFTDLNIDLEYEGLPDSQTTKNFTSLVSKLTQAVKKEIPDSRVSIDSFADAVIKPRVLNVNAVGNLVDNVIIMAYDFHRLNSVNAGPVAPLFDPGQANYDVSRSVTDYLKNVPAQKLILGVPIYGYEWPTENSSKGSFVIGSFRPAEISSYHRSLQTAKDNNVSVNFDEVTKSAWFSYYDKDSYSWRQVWFEDERSLGLKFDLVNQANLSGIGVWALGYDGDAAAPLWQTVKEKLR